jgi:hypothetical protein
MKLHQLHIYIRLREGEVKAKSHGNLKSHFSYLAYLLKSLRLPIEELMCTMPLVGLEEPKWYVIEVLCNIMLS